ncbi:hypothetical protein PV325_004409 [Microctonus aethiopoides]|nr:hypothetical protein PV325_004409 [Microctonus aethiopoides]
METSNLSLQTQESRMRYASDKNEEKRARERRQNLLYLIHDYLRQEGFFETSEYLKKEAKLPMDIKVCDNIDLDSILACYSDYYLSKFNKLPKICKKIDNPASIHQENIGIRKEKCKKPSKRFDSNENQRDKKLGSPETNQDFELTIIPISDRMKKLQSNEVNDLYSGIAEGKFTRKLRPINDLYPMNSEWREIADTITNEIISSNLDVSWSDICGLENCKKLLQEALIYPIKYPEIFTGKFASWRGILLYGPPGTGKTMLAKAVATECQSTFFNITASSLISKWRGESEKYIRVLCDLAIYHSPSIIFIDEIDWTMSGDDDYSGKLSEPARRFRAEFLARLDGLISMEKDNVVLLTATNTPWHLDAALLRRLDKHIFVDLPNENARREILKYYTEPSLHGHKDFELVVANTEYYSGSDMKKLCKEAWMAQMRIYVAARERESITNISQPPQLINSVTLLQEAQNVVLPTARHLANKYKEWQIKMKN